MNTLIEVPDLIMPEEVIIQEKDCVCIDDLSLTAEQVLAEQIERVGNKDNVTPLFIP